MPTSQQQAADAVVAHLVSLRGGAPFLSSSDSRLLLLWLSEGVPVPLLLHALETEAERRRQKRLRTPLSLGAAKKAVKQWKGGERKTPTPPKGGMDPLVRALRKQDPTTYAQISRALEALSGAGEELVEQALTLTRGFFEDQWSRCDRGALMAQADEELAGLRDLVPEPRFQQLREETARDLLRQQHPLLSATAIWDTVGG